MTRRLLIATDAWAPQINGVARTLGQMCKRLTDAGWQVRVVHPASDGFWNFPCPVYPQIRLAFATAGRLARIISSAGADYIHIATEGPLGRAAAAACRRLGLRFTTSYHTQFPAYLRHLLFVPEGLTYANLRRFHSGAAATMVALPSMKRRLEERGFQNLVYWGRGVDTSRFHPRPKSNRYERPVILYVGRVSKEKNLEAMLRLNVAGTKVVVGHGPQLDLLRKHYGSTVQFLGALDGAALEAAYADADVFVFPSKTDTFGLTIIEALASGVPVAAYPVTGPMDILEGHPDAGALDEDLGVAVRLALERGRPEACVALAAQFTWERSVEQFVANLVPVRG
ncbi:MAG: glycosyltransferase family 1 protein [Candidatus Sumerlaeaceae bacterium]|nr:glycosyltransferase family 1 protein [Candidatus Sumerlaeaceae bacterium]